MKLVAPILSSLALTNAFTMTCNDDKTLTVDIAYPGDAEVLALTYGTCDEDSEGVTTTVTDNSGDSDIEIILDIERCEADRELRTLVYNQTAQITIGREGTDGQKLTLAEYDIDATCSFTDEYTAEYAYGVLSASSSEFTQDGGNRAIGFTITPYSDDTFATSLGDSERTTTSGETVYLALTVGADYHDDFEYDTKTFVPKSCVVEAGNFSYTLFDSDNDVCSNSPVDLVVTDADTLDSTMKWTFSHTVFQFQDADEDETYTLTCTVKVCDILDQTECDAVRDCLIV